MEFYINDNELEFDEFQEEMKKDLKADKDGKGKALKYLSDIENKTVRNNFKINGRQYKIVR